MIREVVSTRAAGATPSSSISRWNAATPSVMATIADAAATGDISASRSRRRVSAPRRPRARPSSATDGGIIGAGRSSEGPGFVERGGPFPVVAEDLGEDLVGVLADAGRTGRGGQLLAFELDRQGHL